MNSVDLVTHCWAKQLDQYAHHLQVQLSSVHYWADELVGVIVCACKSDTLTWRVLEVFGDIMPDRLRVIRMSEEQLFRRAIGRNAACSVSNADLIWFTDVDYWFGPHSLEVLQRRQRHTWKPLMMPLHVYRHKDWVTGDRYVDHLRQRPIGLQLVPPDEDFVRVREKLPIGGIQIVPGQLAREVGYLRGTKWMRPVDPGEGFRRCRCDVAFRRAHGLSKERVGKFEIPNVYRLRHTQDGRDYDNQ